MEIKDFFDGLSESDGSQSMTIDQIINEKDEVQQPETKPEGEEKKTVKQETAETDGDDTPFHKHPRFRKLADRIKELEEENQSLKTPAQLEKPAGSADEPPAEWIQMYGDSEESRAAWKDNKPLFMKLKEEAVAETLKKIQEEKERAEQQVQEVEDMIEGNLQSIEETHGMQFNAKLRKEFLDKVEKMSPKDKEGNIIALADFNSVYTEFFKGKAQEKTGKDPSVEEKKRLAGGGNASMGDAKPTQEVGEVPSSWYAWRKTR
jgi:hypothetical protein